MRKLILFKADKGEIEKYRQKTETQIGKSFYRIANVDSVPSLINTIAEHYDSSGKPAPAIGHRLTETIPEDRDSFRDIAVAKTLWSLSVVEMHSQSGHFDYAQ